MEGGEGLTVAVAVAVVLVTNYGRIAREFFCRERIGEV